TKEAIPSLNRLAQSTDEVVRDAANWALQQLATIFDVR
ncbi:MAG TPA: hypothetical protein PKD72_06325, partial [Gemmatales bacterium]|nr:hypothetical protein [Gemmatales bacterium]